MVLGIGVARKLQSPSAQGTLSTDDKHIFKYNRIGNDLDFENEHAT